MDTFLEAMSEREHAKWASWMVYLFEKSIELPSGDLVIPKESVDHWKRQCDTSYADLSEREKQSDRDVVLEFFADVISKWSDKEILG